eukprot:scaffold14.g1059.t1
MVSTLINGTIKPIPLFRVSTQEALDAPLDRRAESYRLQRLAQLQAEGHGTLQPQPLLTPPNVCTLARLLMVPVFVLLWFAAHRLASIATAAVFVLAALTDWLDGYLARKIMVSTALVLLASAPPVPISQAEMIVPVVLMIGREIAMSSLREWAAASGGGAHKAVKVNSLGKWKTALQLVAMSLLLLLRNGHHLLGDEEHVMRWLDWATWASFLVLWVATALACVSLANYMRQVWHWFSVAAQAAAVSAKTASSATLAVQAAVADKFKWCGLESLVPGSVLAQQSTSGAVTRAGSALAWAVMAAVAASAALAGPWA